MKLLKHIRQHSSLMAMGNPMQGLAHYFADGLEARMAGSGAQIYKDLVSKPASAADVLKAYYLYLVVCRLRGYHFSSQTRQLILVSIWFSMALPYATSLI